MCVTVTIARAGIDQRHHPSDITHAQNAFIILAFSMCCRTPVCKPTPLKCALSKINDIETQRALTLSRTLALCEHDLAVDSELLAVSIFYFAFSIETFFSAESLGGCTRRCEVHESSTRN